MKLGFEETQVPYESPSQNARAWTERWVREWVYCPNCGEQHIHQFPSNRPVADFFCSACNEEYELKSQKTKFGAKVLDRERLSVTNLLVIPKHFFVREIIEKRRPLPPTARRAGWVGCNILLNQIPPPGRIFFVRNSQPLPKEGVLRMWQSTLFLREESLEARGWLIEVMRCVEAIGQREFNLADVYAFEDRLSQLYPGNRHIKQKIRQQLQILRDREYLHFVSRGYYRLRG